MNHLKDQYTAWLPTLAAERTETVYSTLGAFIPRRAPQFTPYARRRDHVGRHHAKPVPGQIAKWASSIMREAGEFLVGAFLPVKEAM